METEGETEEGKEEENWKKWKGGWREKNTSGYDSLSPNLSTIIA